jgi:uncharacterized coiled-coil DUF342 family protein
MSKDEINLRMKYISLFYIYRELKHSLNNDLLSPTQEKTLIKEIEDLEKSLPHAM